MSTLDKIKTHAAEIMDNGGPKTKQEIEVVKIFNSISSGKAGNAGKRKVIKTGR